MQLNFFRFRQMSDGRFLLTNDSAKFLFLSAEDFASVRKGIQFIPEPLLSSLVAEGFVITDENKEMAVQEYRKKNKFLTSGPGLHIIIVTLRCCHSCVYCHASRKPLSGDGYDMDFRTAEKTVDFILNSPEKSIIIEFQGGEPLLNFEVIRHIVAYVKDRRQDKKIIFSIVTNLGSMDEDILGFMIENDFRICTSLDGTEEIHNANRKYPGGNSFQNAVKWIQRINGMNSERGPGRRLQKMNALITVTRNMLTEHVNIVDNYINLGLPKIFLRPLNPFGFGKKTAADIAYTADEFLAFYRNSLDYILQQNRKGHRLVERTAEIVLTKMLLREDPNYLDLRSPCGAGVGQLAYNHDGKIYTCDEGRMIAEMGDDSFALGSVFDDSYHAIVNHETVRSLCVASCLEGIPGCNDCVYKPYCGVCPVYNYSEQGSIFGNMATSNRCKIFTGIHETLFAGLGQYEDIYRSWLTDE